MAGTLIPSTPTSSSLVIPEGQYQGAHAADITTRTNGAALQIGDLYFDTTLKALKTYDGTIWIVPSASASGKLLQRQSTITRAPLSGTTTITFGTAIPQITSGTQILSVSITPVSTTSTLLVRSMINATSSSSLYLCAPMFKDGGLNAIASGSAYTVALSAFENVPTVYEETSTTLTARTFTVNIGGNGATWYVNNYNGTITYGNTLGSYIEVLEVEA